MRNKLLRALTLGAFAIAAATYAVNISATPQNEGFHGSTIAKGTFKDDVQLFSKNVQDAPVGNPWMTSLITRGSTDLYVQGNEWQPGGSTGWHTHSGPSLVIVTAGTVSAYDSDCVRRDYTFGDPQNSVFIDGAHLHLLRNEGTITAKTVVVQLVPEGVVRRVDAAAPAGCPFL